MCSCKRRPRFGSRSKRRRCYLSSGGGLGLGGVARRLVRLPEGLELRRLARRRRRFGCVRRRQVPQAPRRAARLTAARLVQQVRSVKWPGKRKVGEARF